MQFQYTPYILPLLASAIISGWMAVYVWQRRRTTRGTGALALLAVAVAEWSLGYALEIAGADLPTKIFWGKSQYFGIVTVPLLWVIFAYLHSNQGNWLTRRNAILLSIIPLITLMLALTTESHGLIWKDIRIETVGRFSALNVAHGYWFWVYWVYSNILILVGTILVFRSMGWMKGLLRRQNIALLVAVLAPWIGNAIYASGLGPIPFMDITPFAFTISVVATTWSIIGFQLIDLAPMARGAVVDEMKDGVIVLDAQGRIADINLSAQNVIGISASQAIGQKALDVLKPWSALVKQYENTLEAEDEVSFGEGDSMVWYELRLSPLVDSRQRVLGRVITARDITERKRVETQLREGEARYRQLIENVSDIIYRTDVHGCVTYANPIALRVMGLASESEALGKHFELVHPAWRQRMRRFYARQLLTGELNTYFEFPAIAAGGRELWFGQNAQIVRDGEKIVGFQAVARDITERKQAEALVVLTNAELENRVSERTAELQDANAFLSALTDVSAILNKSLDLNEVLDQILVQAQKMVPCRAKNIMLVDGSEAYIARRLGYKGLEEIERNLINFRFPLSWHSYQQMITTSDSYNVSDTMMDTNWQTTGNADWVRSYIGIPLQAGGETIGFLNSSHDQPNFFKEKDIIVLKTLAHHAAIAIQNARLLEVTRQGLNDNSALYRVSKGLAKLNPDELFENVVDLLQNNFDYEHVYIFTVDPETGGSVLKSASDEAGKKRIEEGFSLRAGDGIVGHVMETSAPFFTNTVDEVVFFIRDPLLPEITSEMAIPIIYGPLLLGVLDIQQAPPKLFTARDQQLVNTVAGQLAIALQNANLYANLKNALQQEQTTRNQLIQNERLTVMGRLLATISHELNNPLQAIQNALFLLREEKGISNQGQQDLEIVLAESERMADLIGRLRTTYRPPQADRPQPTQINKIVEDVYALISTHLRHRQVTLEFHLDPELPVIQAQSDQIRQVALNLFMNATEAMTDGGKINVSTQFIKETDEILFTVSDTGPGISPDLLPTIFEAFVTSKPSGTGLGLSISHDIVIKHGGRIVGGNNPDQGAIFKVWLPVHNAEIV